MEISESDFQKTTSFKSRNTENSNVASGRKAITDNFSTRTARRRDKIELDLKSQELEETALPQWAGSPTFSRADKISGTTPAVNGILKSFFPFPANTRVLCLSCAAGVDSMLHIEVRVRQARARFRDFNPISRLSH